ncbi:hypothetical protein FACS1894161_5590 [Spirochaetia bacterium]|nr:hypothetical protein FACS1894161_5590 [Spirochaetia bacterium]
MWIDLACYKKQPLYLTELQKKIGALPEAERQEIYFHIIMNTQGRYRGLSFQFPKGKLLKEYRDLCRRYLLAMINNMVVTFGGAEVPRPVFPNAACKGGIPQPDPVLPMTL